MTRSTIQKIVIALIIIAGIGIYGFIQSKELLKGPTIAVESPSNGEILSEPFVRIAGQADRISQIYLNDNQIFTDDTGHFEEPLLLSAGYNILELRATDAFDRETVEVLELVLES